MQHRFTLLAMTVATVCAAPVLAQPADLPIPAATATAFPAGISVAGRGDSAVYVDARGRTLYGLDMRTVHRWSPDPALHCASDCDPAWQPLLAERAPDISFPKGFSGTLRAALETGQRPNRRSEEADVITRDDGSVFYLNPQKAPDWTVIAGPQGPQWVYKGWHLVFVRADEAPGKPRHDGEDNFTWNTLKYVPPEPDPHAPPQVTTAFVAGSYVMTDTNGQLLFTGKCTADCGNWQPLRAGLANHGMGDWSVDRSGDTAAWHWQGKPVFVAAGAESDSLPAGAAMLALPSGDRR